MLRDGLILADDLVKELPIMAVENDLARTSYIASYRCPSDTGSERFFDLKDENGAYLANVPLANYVAMLGTLELEDCELLPVGQQCRSDGPFYHNSWLGIGDSERPHLIHAQTSRWVSSSACANAPSFYAAKPCRI